MKNFMKICAVILIASLLPVASCTEEDDRMCYVCTGFDDGTTSLDDLGTICEGDDNGVGGVITLPQLQAAVADYELFGGTCEMQ